MSTTDPSESEITARGIEPLQFNPTRCDVQKLASVSTQSRGQLHSFTLLENAPI